MCLNQTRQKLCSHSMSQDCNDGVLVKGDALGQYSIYGFLSFFEFQVYNALFYPVCGMS